MTITPSSQSLKASAVAAVWLIGALAAASATAGTSLAGPGNPDDQENNSLNQFQWGSANNPGKISFKLTDGEPGDGHHRAHSGGTDFEVTDRTSLIGIGSLTRTFGDEGFHGQARSDLNQPGPSSITMPPDLNATILGSAWVPTGAELSSDNAGASGVGPGSGFGSGPGPVPAPGAIILLGAASVMSSRRRR